MHRTLFLIPLALSSAACSSKADYARKAGVETGATAAATASATGPAKAASFKDSAKEKQWERSFEYAWPAAASAHPELVKLLAADRDTLLAQEKSEWAAAIEDAPADCTSCGMRSYGMGWEVVADTPGYLSLSGDFATYTGGAHGMYGLRSLVWDKAAKKAMDGAALFTSPDALGAALGQRLCDALNAERAKKGMEPDTGADAVFPPCPKVGEATVLVGSSTGKAFDRIGIWFGPYVAGSYAEGAYELNFPVDAKVLAAVKPEYRAAFGVR